MDRLIYDLTDYALDDLEPIAVDTARIKELTARKIAAAPAGYGAEQAGQGGTTAGQAGRSTQPRTLRFKMLIAACIVVGSLLTGTTVYAVGSALIVGQNPIDFWFTPSDPDVIYAETGGVPIYADTLPNLDDFNVAVGQTLTAEGVAVTLDTIAIDDNFITVFLTYRFDEPIDLEAAVGPGYFESDALRMFIGQPTIDLDGLTLSSAGDTAASEAKNSATYFAETDATRDDRRVVKSATQYLISTMLPDELSLSLTVAPSADGRHVLASAVPEPLTFAVALDKSAAASYTRLIEPGTYEFLVEGQPWVLDVEKFTVSPFGAVFVVNTHEGEDTGGVRYLGMWDVALFDQDGTKLQLFAPGSAQGQGIEAGYVYPATAGSGITSISIQPPTSAPQPEYTSCAVTALGTRLPTSSDTGLIFRDYRVSGNTITFVCELYGTPLPTRLDDPNPYSSESYLPEIILNDDGLDATALRGLIERGLDPETGMYLCTFSFYTADEALLRQISSFCVPFSSDEPSYDRTQALTLAVQQK